jgi:threonylcarbamoyladenosine tRNA methylthiotransferase CDKAL1
VLIPKDENLMGKLVQVDIVETGKHYMKAVLVKDSEAKCPLDVPPPMKQGEVSGLVTEEVNFHTIQITCWMHP